MGACTSSQPTNTINATPETENQDVNKLTKMNSVKTVMESESVRLSLVTSSKDSDKDSSDGMNTSRSDDISSVAVVKQHVEESPSVESDNEDSIPDEIRDEIPNEAMDEIPLPGTVKMSDYSEDSF